MADPAAARGVAVGIIRSLRDAGHIAYLAGGCVRDELLGLVPKDFDVATDAHPPRVRQLFQRTREVGKSFGVVLVRQRGISVEVTTFRQERGYTDRRRPDEVVFADAPSDALRRDFTMNALFIDPLAQQAAPLAGAQTSIVPGVQGMVIDYVGGLADLRAGVVRAVGDPDDRLKEDDLRALRAVRFAARLGFTIDPPTAAAIRRHAGDLVGISRERIGEEIRLILRDARRGVAIDLLNELGLDVPVVGLPARGPATPGALARLPARASLAAALAAWAIDRHGSTPDEPACAAIVRAWRDRLCLSNDERDDFLHTLRGVGTLLSNWSGAGVARRKRTAASPWFGDSLLIMGCLDPRGAEQIARDVAALERTPGGLAPEPLLTGDHLVAAGISPGPGFGRWLDLVYDAQLEGRLASAAEALDMGVRLARPSGSGGSESAGAGAP